MHQGDQILAQSNFRERLVEDWGVPVGARVLEIGCGQGDTTLALAESVGPSGHVLAVDIADPSYGSPVNLADAARAIAEGPMGSRIEFRFLFDILENSFEQNAFDVIVLAHCTWYFSDPSLLGRMLSHIRPWSHKLCLSEWDLQPQTIEQLGHLLAVLIQGQTEAYKSESMANVRSPYSREFLREVLGQTGWEVTSDRLLDTSALADAQWEIAMCLENSDREAAGLMPTRLQFLQRSLLDVLKRCETKPLPSYSITAARPGDLT